MGTTTGISWTEATWNPIRGCLRVSEGCRFCYAETVAARFSGEGQPYEGLARWAKPGDARWTGKVALVESHLQDPLRWQKPRMIFVNSMSDFFFEAIPLDYLDRMVGVMALAPQHTFQVLTKRADRMRDYLNDPAMPDRVNAQLDSLILGKKDRLNRLADADRVLHAGPLPNVWWGVSAEDQAAANARIPALLDTNAAVRWVSYEPAIGPIDFEKIVDKAEDPDAYWYIDTLRGGLWDDANGTVSTGGQDVPALDWIVIGGESHKNWNKARPFDLDWALELVLASQGDGVSTAVYVKQLGSNPVVQTFQGVPIVPPFDFDVDVEVVGEIAHLKLGGKADDPEAFPEAIRVQDYPHANPA